MSRVKRIAELEQEPGILERPVRAKHVIVAGEEHLAAWYAGEQLRDVERVVMRVSRLGLDLDRCSRYTTALEKVPHRLGDRVACGGSSADNDTVECPFSPRQDRVRAPPVRALSHDTVSQERPTEYDQDVAGGVFPWTSKGSRPPGNQWRHGYQHNQESETGKA